VEKQENNSALIL